MASRPCRCVTRRGVYHTAIPLYDKPDQGFVCKTKYAVYSEAVMVFPCGFDFYQQFRPFPVVVSVEKISLPESCQLLVALGVQCGLACLALLQEEVGQKEERCSVGEQQYKQSTPVSVERFSTLVNVERFDI